mmetsp:Transcript_19490/g.66270  ORF Transcript_19490/g.66270 Transcript_19490/m.66270 type:complete len:190 (-) Transcript_19490:1374-1943(-)
MGKGGAQQTSLKVAVVGPMGSGKTTVCRILAETMAPPGYQPTVACRIQEVERYVNGEHVAVELWDCSGDFKYQSCFPAITSGAQGLVVCYDPDKAGQEPEVEKWVQAFAGSAGLANTQCLVLALKSTPGFPQGGGLQGKLKRLAQATVFLPGEVQDAKETARTAGAEIDRLVSGILMARNDATEKQLMG